MRKRIWVWVCWLVLAVTVAALPRTIRAQQVHSEGKRKIIVQIQPAPTPLARRLNLSFTVRLRVTVSPAGDAIRTEELGGSPLLVKAATDGVSQAKWEAAPLQTKEIIEITFPPNPL
jgi:Gram-negative bacterial TonB protein C-terminal